MAVKKDVGTASLRDIIQQSMTAYELAVTTSARTERKAEHSYRQRPADLDARERADRKEGYSAGRVEVQGDYC